MNTLRARFEPLRRNLAILRAQTTQANQKRERHFLSIRPAKSMLTVAFCRALPEEATQAFKAPAEVVTRFLKNLRNDAAREARNHGPQLLNCSASR